MFFYILWIVKFDLIIIKYKQSVTYLYISTNSAQLLFVSIHYIARYLHDGMLSSIYTDSSSVSTEILYVVPDNSTNTSCPSQPCATLSQYYSLDNGTLPVESNVEYHFLLREHQVPANMILQNLHNFSIIGTISKPSPLAVLVLVDCPQSYIINIIDSYNVTIANVILKQCDHPKLTNLVITLCYSCTIENIVFVNVGMIATNLVGRSHLTELVIKSNRKFLMFCQEIALKYWNLQLFTDHKHLLVMNQINMIDLAIGASATAMVL